MEERNTMKNKKVCIFDFDGTIVDSMETFADVAAEVIEHRFGTARTTARRQYIETSGIPFFQQLEIMHPGDKRNADAAAEFEKNKLNGYFEAPLLSGVNELMAWFKANDIVSVVSSNNFQHLVDEFVAKRSLKFDFVLGFKENFAKGFDHFNYIMTQTGLEKSHMLFIGDSIKDGERAYQFGIDFVAKAGIFKPQEFKKHFPKAPVIEELLELKDILRQA